MTRPTCARQFGRTGILALLLACLGPFAAVAGADAPCTKLPDLWFPPPGTALANNGTSVQEATAAVCQGGTIRVTITVDNLTCGDAGGFDVSLYYDSADAGHVVGTKHVDKLPGCQYVTLTFSWNTAAVPPGRHTLLAWADSGERVTELSEANNVYTLPSQVLVSPNAPLIDVKKTYKDANGGYATPKDRIAYEIVLRNDGCADQKDNPGHELVDSIPQGITPAGGVTATSGKAALVGNEVVWDGGIPAGGSVTVTVTVTIDEDVTDSTLICNQAVASWDSNGDGRNEAQEPSDDPTTSERDNDPTCLVVRIPLAYAPIAGTIDAPTLSEWGAIALGILLSLGFVGMLWRRRRLVASGRK